MGLMQWILVVGLLLTWFPAGASAKEIWNEQANHQIKAPNIFGWFLILYVVLLLGVIFVAVVATTVVKTWKILRTLAIDGAAIVKRLLNSKTWPEKKKAKAS